MFLKYLQHNYNNLAVILTKIELVAWRKLVLTKEVVLQILMNPSCLSHCFIGKIICFWEFNLPISIYFKKL